MCLYGDKNIVIVAEDNKVKPFIDRILAYYNNKENYEASSVVRNTYEKWANYKKNMGSETKKGDPPKES